MATKAASTKIHDFVAKYSNRSSGAGYRSAIESFLRSVYDLDKLDGDGKKHDYEALLVQYLSDRKRNQSADVKKFSEKLVRESRSKQSARQILTYSVKFLRTQGVVVLPEFVQDIKRECKGGAATVDETLTNELICRILRGADVRNRAIFLTAASSGLRIGELLSLSMSDINLDITPARVTVRADKAKNKHARFSFLTPEAVDAVKAWLKHRDSYLLESSKHNKNLMKAGYKTAAVKTDSDLLFPVSDSSVNAAWEACLIKAGLHEKNKVKAFKFHSLRKFFYTRLSMALPEKLAQALVGHNGYLDSSYLRITPEFAASEYLKVQDVLTCCVPESVKESIKAADKKIDTLTERTELQSDSIEGLRIINEKLRGQMASQQGQIANLAATQKELVRALQIAGVISIEQINIDDLPDGTMEQDE